MKHKWLIPVVMAGLVGALVWANLRNVAPTGAAAPAKAPAGAPPVKVIQVEARGLTQTVLAPGVLEAREPYEVRAPFTTVRARLLVGEGEQVTAGQVIAELDADELRVQLANQEAAVARAEAAVAQLRQQRQLAPLQAAHRLESATTQLLQAQQGMEQASRQSGQARQRVEQARAAVTALQNRGLRSGEQVEAARTRLEQAEEAYRADPLSNEARQGYDQARLAYEEALRSAAAEAQQASAELAQAQEALKAAEQELQDAGAEDPLLVQQARSQLESARLALELARWELEAGGVLIEQVRSAEADLAAARVSLASTKRRLDQASLKAPAAGTVLQAGIRSGQPVQEHQLLYVIGDLERLTVKARVDEVDIGKVQVGQPLTVRANAYLDTRFHGTVTRVAAQTSTQGTVPGAFFEIQGEVANPAGRLKAGMNTDTRVITETRSGVFVVGLESVREENGQTAVLVVKDFRVEVRPVTLGLRTQTQAEVIAGLQAGEQVIVSPFTLIRSLSDGSPVRPEVTELDDRGEDS